MRKITENIEINVTGKLIKLAGLNAELHEYVNDPNIFIKIIKKRGLAVDIFTFIQQPPNVEPAYNYFMELDNLAVLPVTTFDNWWKKQVKDKTRNLARKAKKKNVIIKTVEFNADLIEGIASIFNETPVRQGRPFWHYGKKPDTIRKENLLYLEKSEYIGAYYKDELIGFIRLIFEKEYASIMYILSKVEHRDKSPNNALIAEAVKRIEEKNLSFLIYAKYIYGRKGEDSLTKFKKHNGFIKLDIPRYYVPVTLKGKIGLKIKMHKGISEIVPRTMLKKMLDLRNEWYMRKYTKI